MPSSFRGAVRDRRRGVQCLVEDERSWDFFVQFPAGRTPGADSSTCSHRGCSQVGRLGKSETLWELG
jgi:hypothetical protein